MSRLGRFALGVAVAGALILVAGWFDGTVVKAAQVQVSHTFDPFSVFPIRALGYLIIAGGSLAIGVAGWRFRSLGLATVYILGGAFFAFIDTIAWKYAGQINDAPPVLPEPLALAISRVYFWQQGYLNAVPILGAAILIVGVLILARTAWSLPWLAAMRAAPVVSNSQVSPQG